MHTIPFITILQFIDNNTRVARLCHRYFYQSRTAAGLHCYKLQKLFVLMWNPSKASKSISCRRQIALFIESTVEILFLYHIMKSE